MDDSRDSHTQNISLHSAGCKCPNRFSHDFSSSFFPLTTERVRLYHTYPKTSHQLSQQQLVWAFEREDWGDKDLEQVVWSNKHSTELCSGLLKAVHSSRWRKPGTSVPTSAIKNHEEIHSSTNDFGSYVPTQLQYSREHTEYSTVGMYLICTGVPSTPYVVLVRNVLVSTCWYQM